MPTFGWHFVRLAFCPVGILSYHPIIASILIILIPWHLQLSLVFYPRTSAFISGKCPDVLSYHSLLEGPSCCTPLLKPRFDNLSHLTHLYSQATGYTFGSYSHTVHHWCADKSANRTKCQLDEMPTKCWHCVRTFYFGWHFVRPNFWLAFCPDHLKMFWHFVRTMKNVVIWVSVSEALHG